MSDLLGDPGWQRLLAAARRKLERDSGQLIGGVSLRDPTDAERRVVIGITGRHRPADVRTLRIDLAELDQALHDLCGAGLHTVLGPLRYRAVERATEAEASSDALTQASAHCPRHRTEPWFVAWLDGVATDGTLTRLVRRGEAEELSRAAQILDRLPADNVPLPVLAEQTTGNTKALAGTPLATLVLRALALRDGADTPARVHWETAGVIVDDLASQVLVLNVRPAGDHAVATWLRDAADTGIPFRLTLHQLNLAPIVPTGQDIYVCENPAVLRAAASQLGAATTTLICTEGQPSAACHTLLTAFRGRLHWRGDFDWTGLRTTATAITRHQAIPWRMTCTDYLTALETGDSEPLKGPPATSPWEPNLADHMARHGRAIMEERLIPLLLNDLSGA
ncbi:TIGR02679 family protein [Actinocrispum wychmicini]|uniref:Uncharacterized protein (TIGR02679 family) n=1 Tax=Actinocrispum wychmicini TaxID=1213861 RepID=A0A4R2JVC0_9PSEU|nr:TIGR02679 family protein [Actinocrispum wychmicini]TCO63002.1 uncharacterized protein (TIGR02679 family) [Actinocrispum wychmicini]